MRQLCEIANSTAAAVQFSALEAGKWQLFAINMAKLVRTKR